MAMRYFALVMVWRRKRKVVRRKTRKNVRRVYRGTTRYIKSRAVFASKRKRFRSLARYRSAKVRGESRNDFKVMTLKSSQAYAETVKLTPISKVMQTFQFGGDDFHWIPTNVKEDIKKDWDRFKYHKLARVIVKIHNMSLDLLEFAGDTVVSDTGQLPTLQLLDPKSGWTPECDYAAWTLEKEFPGASTYKGCRLQNLSADIGAGNMTVNERRFTSFPMFFTKTQQKEVTTIPDQDSMRLLRVTPKTRLGYTLKANKSTNRWFINPYDTTITSMGAKVSTIGKDLSRLHFHQEQYDLAAESFLQAEHGRYDEETKMFGRLKHMIVDPSVMANVYPTHFKPTQLYTLLYHIDVTTVWYHRHRNNEYK